MCGRYALTSKAEVLSEQFGLAGPLPDLPPRYNVAPTQEVPVVLGGPSGGRRLETMRWGLIPSWADDPSIGARLINARSETVAEKPSFRSAFGRRRALMPATGFFEWAEAPSGSRGKVPHHFRLKNGRPFAFAAIWEEWERDGLSLRTCALLTTEANGVVGEVHHRMPVILPPDAYGAWTAEAEDPEVLRSLLVPYPDSEMEGFEVDRRINSPKNEGDAALLQPV
jgi:putative SOS response-associated peptidase YedK